MIVGTSEGERLKFEIVLMSDGFIVQAVSMETGETLADRDRMFRTAPAAFAYASLAARMEDEEAAGPALEQLEWSLSSDHAARVFETIRTRLDDGGVNAGLLAAWSAKSAADKTLKLN